MTLRRNTEISRLYLANYLVIPVYAMRTCVLESRAGQLVKFGIGIFGRVYTIRKAVYS